MPTRSPAFDQCPQTWIEAGDIEHLSFEKATWVPLIIEKTDLEYGKFGYAGYRRATRYFDSIIVPLALKDEFKDVDWQSVTRHSSDGAWVGQQGFVPPGSFNGDQKVLHPVIQRSFETGEPRQWDLLQELEVGLKLFRRGDVWIRPDENDIEVAKLERGNDGEPEVVLFRAEHLRDYLCAKKAFLLLVGFGFRDSVEAEFPDLNWPSDRQERHFAHGNWEGAKTPIHEGGEPYGITMAITHVWRESVNPEDDLPEMPHPGADPGKHKSYTAKASGKKLFALSGRIWIKHTIQPAQLSPRICRDQVEPRVHFRVENQEQKTLAGKALHEYRGWLWFKPSVIRRLLNESKSYLEWYTEQTGKIGPASNQTLHFGLNRLGLINVLGYKMSDLPEWVQKIWVPDNVAPEGGLSEELHMSQNLASPAQTLAPEPILWNNLKLLQERSVATYGQPLLQQLPSEVDFFRRIHRFYCDSMDDVCALCKELHRIVSEQVDLGLLNAKIDPSNAASANEQKLRQIKRVALWLDSLKLDGRRVTQALAGVADFRQGDAHAKSSSLRESLALFGIKPEEQNFQLICLQIIGQVANCVGVMADAIPSME